jgi:queuine tRNA-ribosyltransferase
MASPIRFTIETRLPGTLGRAGTLETPHGVIETPSFVAVGTQATVKSLKAEDLVSFVGNKSIIANTYHLFLQPGHELIKKAGGLHAFMGWQKPLMTDSGGYQVFSLGAAFGKGISKFAKEAEKGSEEGLLVYNEELATEHGKLCIIDEDGVTFTSHHDGTLHRFTPERSIEIQHALGADIIFAFDECTSPTAPHEYQVEALDRTHRWAKRSILAHKQDYEALKKQALYGVVQGGRDLELRRESARTLAAMDFDGFGIGGCFSKADLGAPLKACNEILPEDKPRHLLGIAEPEDIFVGVENGCDTFDCVAPTRTGRTGTLYTRKGRIHIKGSAYKEDFAPVDDECTCMVCGTYTRAFIAHLFRANEMLGGHLASIHNLHFITTLVDGIRASIKDGSYAAFKETFLSAYGQK